ncbi:MAG: menaquinone reductase integral membrane subunit QrcD [Pseudomonadota bacterium]
MDRSLIPDGCRRCSPAVFFIFQALWMGLVGFGILGATLCLGLGLNQTGLNDYFGFGIWIVFDLAIIALGAGAFSTGFLAYVVGKKELKPMINAAVIIGFICYSGAVGMLGIDVGQPIRGWFGFWHANVHSMLTEVMFCITTYLAVLVIEYLPNILENRKLDKIPAVHAFSHNLHEIMVVFAATGAFLSMFHQGSLGGLYGVMYARPFAARTGILIWPWTFFLFIISAVASGPAFTMFCIWLTQKISGRQLVKREVLSLLAKIAGNVLLVYAVLKLIDTYYWATVVAPSAGFTLLQFYKAPYGIHLLVIELACAVLPVFVLLNPKLRDKDAWLIPAALIDIAGICLNRFVFTVQTSAVPVLPFDKYIPYHATWQEWSIAIAMIGYGLLIYSFSYRYLPVFPQERELN